MILYPAAMQSRGDGKMLQNNEILSFLEEYCKEKNIPIERIEKQLHTIGKDIAIFCVQNPDAPAPDGHANDIEILMLPTLYVRKTDMGLKIEETQYTEKHLVSGGK